MEQQTFGRYRFLELLGRGGMGQVFRAYDTDTDRVVAVKVLSPHLAQDKRFQERFRREAHAAAGLNEPHVVPIHNFGDLDGQLYVDMRLIEGRDLESVLARGPMHPRRSVAVIEQVAAALDAAHRIGLIHRDVKPSNILVGERDFVYLIDFGIARGVGDGEMTGGQTIGTYAYMAPERFGSGQTDARADIYALACVLYECLTGRKPFSGETMEQQIAGHMVLPPPKPSALRAEIPMAFDAVIAKGMAKEPEHRYRTAFDLARAGRDALTADAPTTGLRIASAPRVPTHRPAPAAVRHHSNPISNPIRTQAAPRVLTPPPFTPPPFTPPPGLDKRPSPTPWWRRRVVLISGAAAVALGMVVTVVLTAGGGDTPMAKNVSIDTLLLSELTVQTIMDDPSLSTKDTFAQPQPDSAKVLPDACHAIVYIAGEREYRPTAFSAMQEQILLPPSGIDSPSVDQSVFALPSAARATEFLDTLSQEWQSCLNRKVVTTSLNGKNTTNFFYRGYVRIGDLISVVSVVDDNTENSCQRVVAAKFNYLADVSICGTNVIEQGRTVATQILDKLSG